MVSTLSTPCRPGKKKKKTLRASLSQTSEPLVGNCPGDQRIPLIQLMDDILHHENSLDAGKPGFPMVQHESSLVNAGKPWVSTMVSKVVPTDSLQPQRTHSYGNGFRCAWLDEVDGRLLKKTNPDRRADSRETRGRDHQNRSCFLG